MERTLEFLRKTSCTLKGGVLFTCVGIFLIFSLPVYLYRFIITKAVAPWFPPNISKALNASAQAFAVDFLEPQVNLRSGIVVTIVLKGTIDFVDLCKEVDKKWIKARFLNGELFYPELQLYIESWMGFMFWKVDKTFNVENHVHLHKLDFANIRDEPDKRLENLGEKLLNQSFSPKRSPWELHLIQNFNTSDFAQEANAKEFSVLILKIHHAMVDMYSIFNLFVESLCGHPISDLKLAQPSPKKEMGFVNRMTYPLKFLYHLGRFTLLTHQDILHVPDEKKAWYQVVARGKLFQVHKIKMVKNTFNVSFAAVLNSAVSAGLSNFCANQKNTSFDISNVIPIANVGHRPNHPKKLRNHANVLKVEIPLTTKLPSLERLQICDKVIVLERNSPLPELTGPCATLVGSLPVKVTKLLCHDKVNGASVANFAGAGECFSWNGVNVLGMDFVVGGLNGEKGIMFGVFSHGDQIRICVSAELLFCSREEAHKILDYVYEELESLYMLALDQTSELVEVTVQTVQS